MLLDPGDEVRVSVGLLERHDPAGGLVVVHPTPGLSGVAAIAHDVLAALGRSIRRLKAERLVGSAQAGRAVVAWLLADQIEDLVVLRADRLSAAGWDWLLAVCRRTGTRLLLICHVQAVPPALADVLEGTTHEIVTDLRRALPGRPGPAGSCAGDDPLCAGAGGRRSAALRQRADQHLPQRGASGDRPAGVPATF